MCSGSQTDLEVVSPSQNSLVTSQGADYSNSSKGGARSQSFSQFSSQVSLICPTEEPKLKSD